DYDAYGNTLIFSAAGTGGNWWANDAVTTTTPACEFLFTGRQYNPETGNYWYRARYYHPGLGRFLSRDPLGYADGMSQYVIVSNNPVIYLDPHGLSYDPNMHGNIGRKRPANHRSAPGISALPWRVQVNSAAMKDYSAARAGVTVAAFH